MNKQVAIYVRVSRNSQNPQIQIDALTEYANKCGYQIYSVYQDKGVSGAQISRPSFDKMIQDAKHKKFEMILSWSVDRCGRNIKGLCDFVDTMKSLNIALYFHTQNIDTSNAMGACFFHIFSSIAFMERELISERTKASLENARKNGKKLGRPSSLSAGLIEAVKILQDKGVGVRETCRKLGIGCGTYYSITKASI